MKVLKREIKASKEDYYRWHLEIFALINRVKIQKSELNVASLLLHLSHENQVYTLTPDIKSIINKKFNFKTKAAINTYLSQLKAKGIIIYDDNDEISGEFRLDEDAQGFQIKLIKP